MIKESKKDAKIIDRMKKQAAAKKANSKAKKEDEDDNDGLVKVKSKKLTKFEKRQ